jgi:hypothetical protein
MIVLDAKSRCFVGATVATPYKSGLAWNTHMMLGHQGWKVVLEHLQKAKEGNEAGN